MGPISVRRKLTNVVIAYSKYNRDLINSIIKMHYLEEESKGSTSSEEPEYESDHLSDKSIKSDRGAPKIKISLYLSTPMIT